MTTRQTAAILAVTAATALPASAASIKWTDWLDASTTGGIFNASGTITSGTETIGVDYTNPNGVLDLYQGPVDFWGNPRLRDPATSPFTSTGAKGVENIPDGTDIVRLQFAGSQTLSFDQTVENLYFAYVSLNANGYAFDQDFEILSYGGGNLDGNGTDACGYWGCGTSTKQVVEVSPGVFEYQLIGTGEPHGVVRFLDTFDTVSWRSLSSENWNGFTIGVEGTDAQVTDPGQVPVPAGAALLLSALGGFGLLRRRG